jgi:hypothetical protein
MRYFLERNGALRFLFEDINLEDSTSNEPASHGFILFKAKPRADLAPGTEAASTAYIFFDMNPPIVTNTALTTFTDRFTPIEQLTPLSKGWNLVSLYVHPADSSLGYVLGGLAAAPLEAKTAEAFYTPLQPAWLNSLTHLGGGDAFLINMATDDELRLWGLPVFGPLEKPLRQGWNMVGCPIRDGAEIEAWLSPLPVNTAKDFENFWKPSTPASSLIRFEPGKGYFIRTDSPASIIWQE